MRTKLLLFPLVILIMISAIIWRILPDWDGISQGKVDLIELEKQLGEVKKKNSTIDELAAIYKNKTEDIALVNDYIPSEIGDEKVIDNLIYYANRQQGDRVIAVSEISVEANGELKLSSGMLPLVNPLGAIGNSMDKASAQQFSEEMGNRVSIGGIPANPMALSANIAFESSYEGMKDFFAKINSLKRSNNVDSFQVVSDNIENKVTVNALLSFNYLTKYNPEVVNGDFLESGMDDEAIGKIREKATIDTSRINIGPVKRGNPFLPQ